MMSISFYSYKYFFDQREKWGLDERWAFSLACWVPGQILYWIGGLFFLALDTFTGEEGKVYKVSHKIFERFQNSNNNSSAGQRFRFRAWFP